MTRAERLANPERYQRELARKRAWGKENRTKRVEAAYRHALKKLYGLTLEEYDAMVLAQGGRCAVCGKKPRSTKIARSLYVDHNHATGQRRGLVCHRCNLGLGWIEDEEFGRVARVYLARYQG